MESNVVSKPFTNYRETVAGCMFKAGAPDLLAKGLPVMLKPNLVTDSPHPVTTSPAFCEAVIAFVRKYTDAPIVIAEGCGDANLETPEVFERLGFTEVAERLHVDLQDLNSAPLTLHRMDTCRLFPEMWLPACVFDHLLISLPVLKVHSFCKFTGSMKNMMGLAPPKHYKGQSGCWKKAAFHDRLDTRIIELNRYRSPDFTVLDATIGLTDFHLGGPSCDPPANVILAGANAKAVDREATALLGMDWKTVGHLV